MDEAAPDWPRTDWLTTSYGCSKAYRKLGIIGTENAVNDKMHD